MATESDSTLMSKSADTDKRIFTVAQANEALPYVRRVVQDIVDCYSEAVEIRHEIETESKTEDQADQLQRQYDQLMERLNSFIEELHQVGVELKDFERGLIDFPGRHEDRDILLCWHLGEDEVRYWHETDTGFRGRQDVALLEEQPAGPAD